MPLRFALTLTAVILIAVVGISRVITVLKRTPKDSASFDPAARARMIREERSKRR